jgi:flagellar hook-associated protein 1 FlgK
MGGWLEMRDSIIPEYNNKLNQLAHALIGEANSIHAQGVGLETMTDVTASARVSDPLQNLWDQTSGLPYYDAIDSTGSFNIWVYNSSGDVVGGGPVTIDVDGTGVSSLNGLQGTIDGLAHMHAEISTDGKLRLYADAGFSFAFSDDTSNVLSALGINTFFSGKNANDMSVNSALATNKNLIAAGKVDPATGETASGDNSNAIDMAGLQFSDVAIKKSDGSVAAIDTLDNYLASVEGSIGIKSQSITRTKEYNEVIVNKLKETRNNLSAVSLDEEMTQLIKFQHAYGAAAKLISTADEMYQTLLDLK